MPNFIDAWAHRLNAGLAFASYILITTSLALPLVLSITTSLPSDLGDPVLNTWILWWSTQALPLTELWWNAPAFYPMPNIMSYSEHLLGLAPIFGSVYYITDNPVFAYNVTFLLTFPLSGWAMYLLCEELTGRADAAWIAGLAFAFAPYRMDQLAHVQVLASFWMPLALMGLHRYYREGKLRWLVLFGASTLMQGLSNGYYMFYFPVLVILWVCWFTFHEGWWRKVGAVGLAGLFATLPLLPILLRYQRVHESLGLRRTLEEVQLYSADLTGLLSASSHLSVWGWLDYFEKPEGQLFPGLTIIAFLAVVLWRIRWRTAGSLPAGFRMLRVLTTTMAMFCVIGLAYLFIIGPWTIASFGWDVSMNRAGEAIPQTVLVCVIALALSPATVRAYRYHSSFAFYLFAALFLAILAMGPYPSVMGTSITTYSPYLGFMHLPGIDGLRVPARFWMLVLVCLTTVLGVGYSRFVRAGTRCSRHVLLALSAGILIDGWVTFPTVEAPARSVVLDNRVNGPLLELPLNESRADAAAMFRMFHHGQAVVNGYSGYAAPHYSALAYGLGHSRERLLHELGSLGVRYVRIDRANQTSPHYESLVASSPIFRLVSETGRESLYELRGVLVADPPVVLKGRSIPLTAVTASANPHLAAFSADDDFDTVWSSGPQSVGQELLLDLGLSQPLFAVVMYLGRHPMDFPRMLEIELSVSGTEWELIRDGPTDYETVRASLRDPETTPITFVLGNHTARYVRLRQMGEDQAVSWSVAEIDVVAPVS